uniref:Ig-like domain-containing protein n=1 Tax=Monopterus albus TaxID=43700 RepID=A0A3Q3JMB1_MONAL|nr:carcinoembryonic antigen-related cell adhesion molecule 5-like [Monopterus albus]
MRQPVLLISLLLAVLPASVLTQNPVPIQFQTDPVLVQTGTQIVFTVLTVPEVLSMTWQYQAVTLGLWAGGAAVINPVPQFQGRVTITATQLQIGGAQLRDAGNYTVMVTPIVTTGLATNSRTVNLRVFDAVAGVTLVVPSVAIENRNVSLSCTWTAGTEVNVQWGKNDVAIIADSRITISGGSLIINPATRNDTGTYTCTVSNPVSAQTASRSLTVYYGPDTPVLTKETPKQCVGRGDVQLGQAVRLTCTSNSLPPALFSWQYNGQPVASDQVNSGVLTLQTFTTNQSGQYVCTARNTISGVTSQQGTSVAIVDVCLNVGEVVGIVIGCLLFILLIVLLILLILYLRRKRRAEERQGQTVVIQNTNPNTRPIATYSQPNGAREQPPLYHTNTHRHHPDRLYTAQRERRDDPRTLQPNSLYNFNARPHNGRTHTNGLLHNAIQSTNSNPHNGIDNPAFTHTNVQNANTLPNTQRQNPNAPNP